MWKGTTLTQLFKFQCGLASQLQAKPKEDDILQHVKSGYGTHDLVNQTYGSFIKYTWIGVQAYLYWIVHGGVLSVIWWFCVFCYSCKTCCSYLSMCQMLLMCSSWAGREELPVYFPWPSSLMRPTLFELLLGWRSTSLSCIFPWRFHGRLWAVMLRRISKWRFIWSKNCLDWICRRRGSFADAADCSGMPVVFFHFYDLYYWKEFWQTLLGKSLSVFWLWKSLFIMKRDLGLCHRTMWYFTLI